MANEKQSVDGKILEGLLWSIFLGIIFLSNNCYLIAIGFFIISFGAILNLIAIYINKGQMPVFVKNLNWKKKVEESPSHTQLTRETRFKCLCDIYYLHSMGSEIVSAGDVFARLGILLIYVGIIIFALRILKF